MGSPLRCANQTLEKPCDSEGSFTCKNCKLVSVSAINILRRMTRELKDAKYCGRQCQKLHWSTHKAKCRSPLNKFNWKPEWDRVNRRPAWAIGEASTNFHNPFGSTKYLWGNTPAIDIAHITENEGVAYDSDIALLFAGRCNMFSVVSCFI